MRVLKYILLVLIVFAAAAQVQGQQFTPYRSSLDAYTSLSEALKDPDSVRSLTLRHKGYKKMPKEIYKFKNLEELDLKGNKITEVPDSIFMLKNLRYLNLARNELTTISPKIGELNKLEYIELGQNALSALPMEMAGIDSLQYLSIWENEITRIPGTFEKLEKLKEIDLRSIVISQSQREQIKDALPEKTTIYFSPDCNCGK